MEGIFGTNNDHYGLRKIRVKGEKREKLKILFGIIVVNAVKIAKRRSEKATPIRRRLKNHHKKAIHEISMPLP